jgi:hypothetical protein
MQLDPVRGDASLPMQEVVFWLVERHCKASNPPHLAILARLVGCYLVFVGIDNTASEGTRCFASKT